MLTHQGESLASHRVAQATTYRMTEDYKTSIDLVDSITEVPCIMQRVFLVMHNQPPTPTGSMSWTCWVNQHTIHAH